MVMRKTGKKYAGFETSGMKVDYIPAGKNHT